MLYRSIVRVLLVVSLVVGMVLAPAVAGAQDGDRFNDDDGNVHEGFIEAVADEGITEGCAEGRYCPGEQVSRAQMASFLERALDLPAADDDAFVDDDDSVHEDAINAVAAAGIASGCAEDRYCPDEPVRRDQMATFLVEGFGFIPSFVNFFRDDNGNIHEDGINALSRAAVTLGCNDTYLDYCPGERVRRDQMATFLAKAVGLSSHAEPQREITYQVGSAGDVEGDVATFRTVVTDTLRDPRGWSLAGALNFIPVEENAELRVWLASPQAVDNAAPGCSDEYSCRVGNDVYINDERWREGSQTYADRDLRAYQHYVLNHEVGHWVGLDHRECPFDGASAPVMQQQTISLDGCESKVWPQPEELDAARRSLGLSGGDTATDGSGTDQTYIVGPQQPQTRRPSSGGAGERSGQVEFTVVGRYDDQDLDGPLDVALLPCETLLGSDAGVRFADSDDDGSADGTGDSDTGAAFIDRINGRDVENTGHVRDVAVEDGQLSATVDSEQADCAALIVWDDANDNGALDVDEQGAATEAWGYGRVRWEAGSDTAAKSSDPSGPAVVVTDVRVGDHGSFDRIVFEIAGDGTAGWHVEYVDQARSQGSGEPVEVAGEATLEITLSTIAYPDDAPEGTDPWDGHERMEPHGSGPLVELVEDTLFEGDYTFFAGTTGEQPFDVYRLDAPQRVVIDVSE